MTNFLKKSLCIATIALGMVASGRAATLLDDTFADGTRTNQNLPTDSAWFFSSASAVTTTTGNMAVLMPSSSLMGITYFGANSSSPAQLNIGDMLTATIKFSLTNVNASNSSQGFTLGLFDFADSTLSPKWVTADGFSTQSQGTNVQGYALFQNMGMTFNSSSPMTISKRTTAANYDLLGTGGDWTSLTNGPGNTNNFPGFTNGQYTLQIALQRLDSTSLAITVTWQNLATAAMLSTSVTDSAASTFSFDGIAMRPSGAAKSATNIVLNEVSVDAVLSGSGTPASVTLDPQSLTVFTNQSASFSVTAAGSAPLSYQWFFTNVISGATNSALTITNAKLSDAGSYYVIVTNSFGSDTSAVATLTVNIPDAPSIITQPQNQNIPSGGSATFSVVAGGSEPLSYQWYYNTNTMVTNATSPTLTITNVQSGNVGSYSVFVSNLAGGTNSAYAFLTINTTPVAPTFNSQPASQVVLVGGTASFSAAATGTAPITYQWNKNGVPISGATSSTLNVTNVQVTDSGSSYTVTASNSVNSVTSSAAVLTVTTTVPVANSAYNLTGFAQGTTGGGVIATNDPAYVQVYTPLDLANALQAAYKTAGSVKVIEIMNDLNLGWNEVGPAVQAVGPFRENIVPLLHPVLLTVGESLIDIKPRSGLTIFSANGATMKHCNFNIKSCSNVIVRNLKFDENWEWDESTKGQYDRNDWDFITVGNGGAVSNLWVDHCTFTKSYDGILDTKAGCSAITISWCKYAGDDGATNTNSWVWQQINSLESNKTSYAFYNFLRTHGFSTTNIVTIMQAHDKTHLAGQNDLDPNNATITMTFHHLWLGVWDRCVPRLRAGNVHDYNIYVDDTSVLAAKRLRDAVVSNMSTNDQNTINNTYDFNPPVNGAISTESGALLVEKSVYIDCLWPLRNNQTDPSNPEYTGKIQSLDSIYQFDGTTVRGNSTDSGNPMGPLQAPVIPFSWNLPGNQLPYTYTMDDPAQLQAIVTSPTAGAGAGVLTWAKTNWLMTTYPAMKPFIVAQPQNITVNTNQSATFTVVAGGSSNLGYQWYFNTNTPVLHATNSSLTLTSVQSTNVGVYSVVVTNSAGSATSTNALLNLTTVTPANPQVSAPVFSKGTFSLTVNGDSGHNYIVQVSTNLTAWTSIFTNPMPTLPFNWTDSAAGNFNQRFYRIQLGP